jgi:hypothetical protein
MIFKRCMAIITGVISIHVSGLAQDMTIKQLNSNKVAISMLQPSSLPSSHTTADLPNTLLTVTNTSEKAITCLVMKWVSHKPGMPDETRWHYFDGYGFPPVRTVIGKGETLIVSEFGAQKQEIVKDASSAKKMDSPLSSHFGDLPLTGSITASADLVVFDDGEIVGDNTSEYDQSIILRHRAMLEVGEKMQGLASSEERKSRAASFVTEAKGSSDKSASIRASLAQTVLRSPNGQGTAKSFANHTIPEQFYRQQ